MIARSRGDFFLRSVRAEVRTKGRLLRMTISPA